MFLTHEASYYANRFSLDVLSQELYGKYVHNSSQALFRHLKGRKSAKLIIYLSILSSFFLAW
jgi:hypothetical protein